MAQTIRVSLPGYNALTDTNPDHYALYADSDNVLIKEKARGSISVSNSSSENIAHSLSYIPFVIVFFERTSNVWRKLTGDNEFSINVYYSVSTTNLTLSNYSGSTKTFKYYIFYDQMV